MLRIKLLYCREAYFVVFRKKFEKLSISRLTALLEFKKPNVCIESSLQDNAFLLFVHQLNLNFSHKPNFVQIKKGCAVFLFGGTKLLVIKNFNEKPFPGASIAKTLVFAPCLDLKTYLCPYNLNKGRTKIYSYLSKFEKGQKREQGTRSDLVSPGVPPINKTFFCYNTFGYDYNNHYTKFILKSVCSVWFEQTVSVSSFEILSSVKNKFFFFKSALWVQDSSRGIMLSRVVSDGHTVIFKSWCGQKKNITYSVLKTILNWSQRNIGPASQKKIIKFLIVYLFGNLKYKVYSKQVLFNQLAHVLYANKFLMYSTWVESGSIEVYSFVDNLYTTKPLYILVVAEKLKRVKISNFNNTNTNLVLFPAPNSISWICLAPYKIKFILKSPGKSWFTVNLTTSLKKTLFNTRREINILCIFKHKLLFKLNVQPTIY